MRLSENQPIMSLTTQKIEWPMSWPHNYRLKVANLADKSLNHLPAKRLNSVIPIYLSFFLSIYLSLSLSLCGSLRGASSNIATVEQQYQLAAVTFIDIAVHYQTLSRHRFISSMFAFAIYSYRRSELPSGRSDNSSTTS